MWNLIVCWVLYFFCYSILGWMCETVYCSIGAKKLVNRGFLNGPLCPVYGFGALLVLSALRPLHGNPLLIFFVGAVLTSALEYVTGWLLETIFHMKLWDYSKRILNLHGRVCLRNSVLFGLLCVVLDLWIHPLFARYIEALPTLGLGLLGGFLCGILFSDCLITVYTFLRVNGHIQKMQAAAESFHQTVKTMREEQRAQASAAVAELRAQLERMQTDTHALERRVLRAFPQMQSKRYPEAMEKLKTAVRAYVRKKKQ